MAPWPEHLNRVHLFLFHLMGVGLDNLTRDMFSDSQTIDIPNVSTAYGIKIHSTKLVEGILLIENSTSLPHCN
jgi:hypothetical protein